MKYELLAVNKINITRRRHRRDMGDLEALAANIRELGLLQPIGVDAYYRLIFGQRRLQACSIILEWTEIPAVVLSVDSILAGEYAENEFRKQFTASERAAIGKAIEEELQEKDRRGRPEKTSAIADVYSARGASVDLAAKRAGFKSAETYERARTVTERGAPEVIRAMDSGELSITAAADIASQPQPEQERIVRMPKDERREVVRQIRKTKAQREEDERHAYDIRVFRGLNEHVEQVAKHQVSARETWAGLERVFAYHFSQHLDRAVNCLVRLQKEQPNAGRKPGIVKKKAQ